MSQPSFTSGDSPFRVVLRRALPPAAGAGLLTAVVLWLVSGPGAGLAGVVGVLIALAFFGSGLLLMARFVRDNNPMVFMAAGMAIYFGQVIALLLVLIVAREVESFDSWSAGIAMLVTIVVWQVAQVLAWRRARVPVYDAAAVDQEPT